MTSKERKIARKSLSEERKAIRDYTSRRRVSRNQELRDAITHALGEERTHAHLFSRVLAQ